MPVRPTYPGVYIEEVPSGVKSVTGVATSIAAFVGSFGRGPVDQAVRILSMADFERDFGGLDRFSETSYAVAQFFANGGGEAWIVRVADAEGDAADPDDGARAAAATLDGLDGEVLIAATAGRRVRGQSARNPGVWGNALRLAVDHDTAAPGLFNLTVAEIRTEGGRDTVIATETFRNLTAAPNQANSADEVVNAGSRLIQIAVAGGGGVPAPTGTLVGGLLPDPPDLPADGTAIAFALDGAAAAAALDYDGAPPATYAALAPVLQRAIRAAAATSADVPAERRAMLAEATVRVLEEADGARLAIRLGRGPRPFGPAIALTAGGAEATALALDAADAFLGQAVALTGGDDGPPAVAPATARPLPAAALIGGPLAKTGLFALDAVDLFNILCLPEATTLGASDMRAVYAAAIGYARNRRAMVIVDLPEAAGTSLDGVQAWLADNEGLRDANAAVYFPRTNVRDPLNAGRARSIAASGTIAGLWARTDAARGVWKAPAGTEARLRNIESLGCVLTDGENGLLNPLGVNCLRTFPVYSSIAWGARTLEGADALASDWKYIPVRRLTLFLEESLYRGTKWVVFEPNDEALWSQIRLNLGAFLHDLFRQGAFQGRTPRDAYFVKCDGETTTQTDINAGIVNIAIGFAPLKPAEFVVLRIQQIAGAIEA